MNALAEAEIKTLEDGGDDEIYTYIDEAEEKSSTTCEICGMPGTMNEDGWIEVRCTECSKLK